MQELALIVGQRAMVGGAGLDLRGLGSQLRRCYSQTAPLARLRLRLQVVDAGDIGRGQLLHAEGDPVRVLPDREPVARVFVVSGRGPATV